MEINLLVWSKGFSLKHVKVAPIPFSLSKTFIKYLCNIHEGHKSDFHHIIYPVKQNRQLRDELPSD